MSNITIGVTRGDQEVVFRKIPAMAARDQMQGSGNIPPGLLDDLTVDDYLRYFRPWARYEDDIGRQWEVSQDWLGEDAPQRKLITLE